MSDDPEIYALASLQADIIGQFIDVINRNNAALIEAVSAVFDEQGPSSKLTHCLCKTWGTVFLTTFAQLVIQSLKLGKSSAQQEEIVFGLIEDAKRAMKGSLSARTDPGAFH